MPSALVWLCRARVEEMVAVCGVQACGGGEATLEHRLAVSVVQEAMKRVVGVRKYSGWLTPASGVLLVAGGTYAVLSRVF